MVAINFTAAWTKAAKDGRPKEEQKQEVFSLIRSGTKFLTVREKKPKCKMGDMLQLYFGMRTKDCELIMETYCTYVCEVEINSSEESVTMPFGLSMILNVIGTDYMAFVKADGFGCRGGDFFDFHKGKSKAYVVVWKPATQINNCLCVSCGKQVRSGMNKCLKCEELD